jgi:prepilin-type N-terminal cleavage/methylation domain-containing protein
MAIPLRRNMLTSVRVTTVSNRRLSRVLARLRDERGFTLIELIMTSVILAIISAPIAGVMLAAAASSASSRERTAADQMIQAKLETIRTLPYTSVGLVNGNPSGVLVASQSTSLPSGEKITIATTASWVTDAIPTAYVTHADYKKVTVTITRQSDGKQLSQNSTLVASASAPPLAGTGWVQIKRQVVDAVTTSPLPGAGVTVTGGPNSITSSDTTDGSGTVLFPALASSTAQPPPNYTLATTLTGYNVFPDDLPPGLAEQVGASPGLNSTTTLRMYLPTSLTVNLKNSSGNPYTSGATVSLQSSRCGLQSVSVPSGQSSTTITTCNSSRTVTAIPLVPNVLGQTPLFDKYGATAASNSGGLWGSAAQFTVPSAYPTTLTQSVNITLATSYSTKTLTVTVMKGGSVDTNARVNVSGGPAGVFLFATTNTSGQATFTIPVTSTATAFTVSANDQGTASGTASNTTWSTSTSSPISSTVTIS